MELPTTDRITSLLTSFLDVQSRRAEVVAGNIANADTPGYTAKDLDFTDYLKRAAREALMPLNSPEQSKGFGPGDARVIERATDRIGIDGNTVDTGREMSSLADAGMQYLAGTQFLQSRLRTLRAAIREGR